MKLKLPNLKSSRVAILVTIVLALLVIRLEGRVWFCECGELRLWVSDANSKHTSQHLTDPYSFSHVQHGFVFLALVTWIGSQWSWRLREWLVIFVECCWEVLENSPWVIERYRTATAALGYAGDSVLNAAGDILCCWLGVLIAHKLGWKITAGLYVVIEVAMILTIRDSLLLNVLMLFWPVEAIKQWQMAA